MAVLSKLPELEVQVQSSDTQQVRVVEVSKEDEAESLGSENGSRRLKTKCMPELKADCVNWP
jgi:hypothetical protein